MDLEYNDSPICPHCGDEWDTPWEIIDDMADGDEVEYECGACGGSVLMTVHVNVNYSTRI